MRKIKLALLGLLLFGAAYAVSALEQEPAPNALRQQPSQLGHAANSEHWVMQPLQPVPLKLNLSPGLALTGVREPAAAGGKYRGLSDQPLTSIKLFNSGGVSAEWRYGQIQYTFSGVKPLGGSIGGKLSSNSVKLTLTWSGQE